jgi:hopene-associated glycosyltransferase HpnB
MPVLLLCVTLSALMWWGLLLWPAYPWRYRETFEARNTAERANLSKVTVVVPARNESGVIGRTLGALARQGVGLRVVLVDDQSVDTTAEEARESGLADLVVLAGAPLPQGWVGKLWALEQGTRRAQTPWVMLLDADIELKTGVLPTLLEKAEREGWDAVSIMAAPHLETQAERFFLPAFVYFFKLLYPFVRVCDPRRSTAAAAGGCILLRREALTALGGFAPIRSALIDDCTLARRLKTHGYRIWLGVSHDVNSLRRQDVRSVARMVMRTAYTQLRRSPFLLLLTTFLMLDLFVAPWVGLLAGGTPIRLVSLGALFAMAMTYLPTLIYYRQPRWMVATLTPVSLGYLFWTWQSALRDFRGVRSEWKGRLYRNEVSRPASDGTEEPRRGV